MRRLAPCLWTALFLLASASALADELERFSVRRASDLLAPELVENRYHRVREDVLTFGFVRHYTIETEWGEFRADGDPMLRIRVYEIGAIAELERVSKLDKFGEGIEKAVTNPVHSVVDFVKNPADTVSGVPRGVGRWFSRLGGMVTGERGELEEGYAKELIGFSRVKRGVAHSLGVNPYSSNAVLQKELNRVAWTMFAGGVAIQTLFAAGNEGALNAYMAIGIPRSLNQLLLDETPEDLQKRNRASLEAMGVAEETIGRFLFNPEFSPAHETSIALSLEALPVVAGRDVFVAHAAENTEDESDALAYQQQAAMLAAYHAGVEPLTELFSVRSVIAGRTASGRVAIVLPLDDVYWTAALREAAQEVASRFEKVDFAISGTFSERAERELGALGIASREGLRPGA